MFKYAVFFCILFQASWSFALSNKDYEELVSGSPAFAEAEKRLNKNWKALNEEERKKLLLNQREWVKKGRDAEAELLMTQGEAKFEAYAQATQKRADYFKSLQAEPKKKDDPQKAEPKDEGKLKKQEPSQKGTSGPEVLSGLNANETTAILSAFGAASLDGSGWNNLAQDAKTAYVAGYREAVFSSANEKCPALAKGGEKYIECMKDQILFVGTHQNLVDTIDAVYEKPEYQSLFLYDQVMPAIIAAQEDIKWDGKKLTVKNEKDKLDKRLRVLSYE